MTKHGFSDSSLQIIYRVIVQDAKFYPGNQLAGKVYQDHFPRLVGVLTGFQPEDFSL